MNIERFYTLTAQLQLFLLEAEIELHLKQLVNAVQNLIDDPSNSDHEKNVSEWRQKTKTAIGSLPSHSESLYTRSLFNEFELEIFLPDVLKVRFDECFLGNEITPSITKEKLTNLQGEFELKLEYVNSVTHGLSGLNVQLDELNPAECVFEIRMPKNAEIENPKVLGKEIAKLNMILGPFGQICAKNNYDIKVRSLASSDFLISLQIVAGNVALTAAIVGSITYSINQLINVYKNVYEARIMKQKLIEMNAKQKDYKSLEDFAERLVKESIEATVKEVMDKYSSESNKGIANENSVALTKSLEMIAHRIDKGMDFETRMGALPEISVELAEDGTENTSSRSAEEEAYENVRSEVEARNADFRSFERAGEPILMLPEPDNDNVDNI